MVAVWGFMCGVLEAGEGLEKAWKRIDLGAQRSQNIEGKPRFGTKLVMRRRFVCHPRGYAGDRPVRLRDDDQLSTTVGVLPDNEHGLATPGMERIGNPPLHRVLAGR